MKVLKFIPLGCLLIIFSNCTTIRTSEVVINQNEQINLIGIVPQSNINHKVISYDTTHKSYINNSLWINKLVSAKDIPKQFKFQTLFSDSKRITILKNQFKNIQTFAQVKAMAANGSLELDNKQLKHLDKLESKYHGDLNQFKKHFYKKTDNDNVILLGISEIVGIIGLLLLLITGSALWLILCVPALLIIILLQLFK